MLTAARRAGLCALALALLGAAWSMSLPYNGTADEVSHLIRAMGAAGGDVVGSPVPLVITARTPAAADQQRFLLQNTRAFAVPPALNGAYNSNCFVLKPAQPPSCMTIAARGKPTEVSHVGNYPPLAYFLPGLVALRTGSPMAATVAARIANGVTCAVLWGLAGTALLAGVRGVRRRAWLLSGLLLAITPASVALAWSVNPNGVEAAGSVAFLAVALAATRPGAPRWTWWALGPVGIVLAGSRPVAPLWVVFAALVVLLLRGRALLGAVRAGGRAAASGLALSALGGIATFAWNEAIGAAPAPGQRHWADYVSQTWHQMQDLQGGVISQVDWGEIGMLPGLRDPWEFTALGLALVALLFGRLRQRIVLVLVLGLYFVACVGIVGLTAPSGFPTGGRYVLAAAVTIPLVCGEILAHRDLRFARPALTLVCLVVVGSQVAVLFFSAHRYAVGVDGPWTFLWSGSVWPAVAGWPLVTALALAGALLLIATAAADRADRIDRTDASARAARAARAARPASADRATQSIQANPAAGGAGPVEPLAAGG